MGQDMDEIIGTGEKALNLLKLLYGNSHVVVLGNFKEAAMEQNPEWYLMKHTLYSLDDAVFQKRARASYWSWIRMNGFKKKRTWKNLMPGRKKELMADYRLVDEEEAMQKLGVLTVAKECGITISRLEFELYLQGKEADPMVETEDYTVARALYEKTVHWLRTGMKEVGKDGSYADM